jgi:hypothetical protein
MMVHDCYLIINTKISFIVIIFIIIITVIYFFLEMIVLIIVKKIPNCDHHSVSLLLFCEVILF